MLSRSCGHWCRRSTRWRKGAVTGSNDCRGKAMTDQKIHLEGAWGGHYAPTPFPAGWLVFTRVAMDRTFSRCGRGLLWTLAGLMLCLPLSGCAKVLATAMYVVTGNNSPAEYDGLKGKKVAVVCRQLTS